MKFETHDKSGLSDNSNRPGPNSAPGYSQIRERARDQATPPTLPRLTLGQARSTDTVVFESRVKIPYSNEPVALDLLVAIARCRIKAEACRWASERKRLIATGRSFAAYIAPNDDALLARAKSIPNCYLWMSSRDGLAACHGDGFDAVADCFTTLAETLELANEFMDTGELTDEQTGKLLQLVATAQSALRKAIKRVTANADNDQKLIFNWLSDQCSERRIRVARHMQLDDLADPTTCDEVSHQIKRLRQSLEQVRTRNRNLRKLTGKARHKAKVLAENTSDSYEQWQSLLLTIDQLIDQGIPPSNIELRDMLLPIIDSMPDDCELSPSGTRVLSEIDRYLARTVTVDMARPRALGADVANVARLLRGRELVIIGGDKRQANARVLKEVFELAEINWIETKPHESLEIFVPKVSRSEVALVALAIRWSSHSYGDVQRFCKRFGKPLVRLPGGYNPNQIASQILKQCSKALSLETRP